MNCENIDRNIAPFYMAVMLELERRRLSLNISMDEISDRAGIADRLFSKALHASTPSGRQARWETIQDLVDALFPAGYDVIIKPKTGMRLNPAQMRCKIKFAAAAANPKLHRELMSELGKKSARVRKEKFAAMTEEERKRAVKHIVRKARRTRRQNKLLRAQAAQAAPQIKRVQSGRKPVVDAAPWAPVCTMDGCAPPAGKGSNGHAADYQR
jgi:hypothetical protein